MVLWGKLGRLRLEKPAYGCSGAPGTPHDPFADQLQHGVDFRIYLEVLMPRRDNTYALELPVGISDAERDGLVLRFATGLALDAHSAEFRSPR